MRDDIEVSLCLDQGVSDEDVGVDQLEIFVYLISSTHCASKKISNTLKTPQLGVPFTVCSASFIT